MLKNHLQADESDSLHSLVMLWFECTREMNWPDLTCDMLVLHSFDDSLELSVLYYFIYFIIKLRSFAPCLDSCSLVHWLMQ